MTKHSILQFSDRDTEILTALARTPLTPSQLFILSDSFAQPFHNEQNVRRRLRELRTASLVQSFPYAVASDGRSPNYFKLTRTGYRMFYGIDAPLPKRRFFEPIRDGHHHHTRCLADFIVHTIAVAQRNGFDVRHFSAENSVCIDVPPFKLFPDSAFQLAAPGGRTFNFVVELDNGTERVRSKIDTESIERKIRGYDRHQSAFSAIDPQRYMVLFVTTRSGSRLRYMLDLAQECMINPQRTVFLGIDLRSFLDCPNPLLHSVWLDNHGKQRPLVSGDLNATHPSRTLLTPSLQLC
jgi:hypothetical protein